jgi:hypothetical protein
MLDDCDFFDSIRSDARVEQAMHGGWSVAQQVMQDIVRCTEKRAGHDMNILVVY